MFHFQADGITFLAENDTVSWYGDKADVLSGQDNGVSAFGYRYVDNPDCMGVALPTQKGGDLYEIRNTLIPYTGKNWATCTKVRVYSTVTKKQTIAAYVDKGPSTFTNCCADLLPAVLKALGLNPKDGHYPANVRVLGPFK